MFLAEHFQTFLVCVVAITLFSRTSIKITAKNMEQSGKFENSTGAVRSSNGDDDDGGVWQVVNKNKRLRKSTGGTFESKTETQTVCRISKDQFKAMSVDDKLVSMFDMMAGFTSLNTRVHSIEQSMEAILVQNANTNRRMQYLEYKSIDMESRSRRNNLIFRGLPEVLNDENCIAIVKTFLKEQLHLDGDSMYIQRAHRIGSSQTRRSRGRAWGASSERERHRPMIACIRDYNDIETILGNGRMLRGTSYGVNRDYPKEITAARGRLWSDYKAFKSRYPAARVIIAFPAKLIVNGTVKRDEFPDWNSILKGDTSGRIQPSQAIHTARLSAHDLRQPTCTQPGTNECRQQPDLHSELLSQVPNEAEPEPKSSNQLLTCAHDNKNDTCSTNEVIMSDDHSDADTESTGTAQDEYSPAMKRLSQLSQNRADRESETESDKQPPLESGNNDSNTV